MSRFAKGRDLDDEFTYLYNYTDALDGLKRNIFINKARDKIFCEAKENQSKAKYRIIYEKPSIEFFSALNAVIASITDDTTDEVLTALYPKADFAFIQSRKMRLKEKKIEIEKMLKEARDSTILGGAPISGYYSGLIGGSILGDDYTGDAAEGGGAIVPEWGGSSGGD